jgi:hypothetical protein
MAVNVTNAKPNLHAKLVRGTPVFKSHRVTGCVRRRIRGSHIVKVRTRRGEGNALPGDLVNPVMKVRVLGAGAEVQSLLHEIACND